MLKREINELIKTAREIESADIVQLKKDLKMAWSVAFIASKKRLSELESQGDKWSVMDGDREVGRLQDVCGFAHVIISGRERSFVTAFQELSGGRDIFHYGNVRIYLSKGSRGYILDFFDLVQGPECQYMSVQKAAVNAGAEYLKKKGWIRDFQVWSKID